MLPAPRRVSVVVPTKNAGPGFAPLCRHLQLMQARFDLEVLVIDSGSQDGTVAEAERAGFRVHRIAPEEFGHGRTRNLGVRMSAGEVVCFLTQDVLPCTPDWPARFAAALRDPRVAGVYGRQVPRDAYTVEMFFVALNYPPEPCRFGPDDAAPRPGRVVFSTAFAAVRRDVWQRFPFPEDVPVSEDQTWAQAVLGTGYEIAYEPAAEALHAHRYTLRALFRRNYLIAAALRQRGLDSAVHLGAAMRVLAREVAYFVHQGHVIRLPQLLVYEFVRWLGFQAGRRAGRQAVREPQPAASKNRPARPRRFMAWLVSRLAGGDPHMVDVVQGASFAVAARAAGATVTFALSFLLARILGAEGAGLFFLALTVASIASVFARAGMDHALLRFSAAHAGRSEWDRVAGARRHAMRIVGWTSLVGVALVAGAAPWIASTVFRQPALSAPLRIAAVLILPATFLALYVELLRGIGRIRDATSVQHVVAGLLALPALAILGPWLGVEGAVAAQVFGATGALLLAIVLWRRATPQLRAIRGMFDRGRLLTTALPLLWVASMDLVIGVTDTVMLGLWRSAGEVGVYGVALRTAALAAFALVAVNTVAAPKFAALHAQGSGEPLSKLARSAARLTVWATLPLILVFAVVPEWILGLFGAEFRAGAWALRLLAAGQLVNVATGSVGYLLTMTGHEKLMRNNILFCAALNVSLNALLIPRYGILGAAAASAISLASMNIISSVLVYRRLAILALPVPRRWWAHAE